jgi:hypothetical protein
MIKKVKEYKNISKYYIRYKLINLRWVNIKKLGKNKLNQSQLKLIVRRGGGKRLNMKAQIINLINPQEIIYSFNLIDLHLKEKLVMEILNQVFILY